MPTLSSFQFSDDGRRENPRRKASPKGSIASLRYTVALTPADGFDNDDTSGSTYGILVSETPDKHGWSPSWAAVLATATPYAALPFTIGSVGLTTGLVLGRFDLTSKSWVWADLMLLALTALLAGAGWGVKEFFSPTRSRTPAWLVENGY